MGGVFASARLFLRGPAWTVAGVIGALLTAVAVAEVIRDAPPARVLAFVCLALVAMIAASFWSFHRIHREAEVKKEALPRRIDDLHREGDGVLKDLTAPVQPQEIETGTWEIALSDAPADWWDRAADFDQRIRDLFMEQYPALLSDYARGANEHLRATRQAREERAAAIEADPAKDKRSDSEKMLDFANRIRLGPAERVEASLEGLAAARHRVGSAV